MVWLDDENERPDKSYFFLFWLTTTNGRKFHVTLAPNFRLGETTGIFRVEDLEDCSWTGATVFGPGSGNTKYLDFRSEIQNLTSPRGGDNYTNLHITTDYAGVVLDVHMNPTGKNLYIGGNGGVALGPRGSNDYSVLIPGWSWYWGNPTLHLEGTITFEGEKLEIDCAESRGYFERQTGNFGISGGHWGFWLYLSNGLFVHGWVVTPTIENPAGKEAWATVWHPNGMTEVLEVDNTTSAWNIWKSEATGNNYFQDFRLDLSQRQASINLHQLIRKSEITPLPDTRGYNITEAYGQGDGIWEGQNVTWWGHIEQLSYW
ncbi:uncharacterized protein J7T54_000767 [Emericellopsis cladophorae]|uniref:AttH domain-containing protein n=1 Tax=Emericellopsis cladophorae TaxID=2686198 RepID=A0A9P9XW56_9HYPO|nr:uncharacterized protein J7T54_000767 [Emericellopsis cladophorae]KAI6778733.1 hypothetical protein J7T54_000767 [Emericellopsis cladophorae]